MVSAEMVVWEIDDSIDPPDIRQTSPKVMGDIVCEAPTGHFLSMAGWPKRSRLIVAAPDLLAAAKALLEVIAEPLEVVREHQMDNAIQAMADAIAKAEGHP